MNSHDELKLAVEMEVTRVSEDGVVVQKQSVVTEIPFTLYINDNELATLQCSPEDLQVFAYGFLYSACIMRDVSEIESCVIDRERWTGHVRMNAAPDLSILAKRFFTSGCGKGVSFASVNEVIDRHPLKNNLSITSDQVSHIAVWLQSCSPLSRETGGLHTAALSELGELPEIVSDDIGRHNAVDKVIGKALLAGRDLSRMVLVCSGRVSSEIFQKAKRAGIEVIIARGAPTHQTILRALDMNMTIVGFARGKNFTVYSHPERVVCG